MGKLAGKLRRAGGRPAARWHGTGEPVAPDDAKQRFRLLDDQARARGRQQEDLAAIGHFALTSDDVQQLAQEATARIATTLNAECAGVLELNAAGKSLLLRAGVGWRPGAVGHVSVDAGPRSHAGFALLANEPVIVTDLRTDRRFSGSPLLRKQGVVSGITVVISGQARPYGVLAVHSKARREFTAADVHFLRSVANVLAAAIRARAADQAMRDSEARMRAIVTTAVDGIITIDHRGVVDTMNPAAERLFGYAAAEVVGCNISMLMPEPYRSEHDTYVANYLHTGRAKIIGIGREVVGRRKDGSTFPMDLAVSELRLGERRMFTGLIRDVTERRRMEQEILDASAAEQRRIGQDLHDGLCQHLAGIAFATEVLSRKLKGRDAPEAASAEQIGEMLDKAITQARDLARGLQPVTLQADGLTSALQQLAAKVSDMFHVSCLFWCDREVLIHDNVVATHLFRITQEAVSNAIRHGKARRIVIDLTVTGGELRLTVTDDGVGIPAAVPSSDGKGIGIQTMAYRARMIGGTLTVRPGAKGGTVVSCVLPDRGGIERIDGKASNGGQKAKQESSRKRADGKGRGPRGNGPVAGASAGTGQTTGAGEETHPAGRRPPDRPRATGRADRAGKRPGRLR